MLAIASCGCALRLNSTKNPWRLCPRRAVCENELKSFNCYFVAGSLNLRDFWANEAALHTLMMAFNLMTLFRQMLLAGQ